MKIQLKKGDIYTIELYNPITKLAMSYIQDYDPMIEGEEVIVDTSRPIVKIKLSGDYNYMKIVRGKKTLWER